MNNDDSSEYIINDILGQIFDGVSKYSISIENNVFDIYIKHALQNETLKIFDVYQKFLKKYSEDGIMPENEQLDFICKNGWWSKEKENEISYAKDAIKRLEQTRKKLIYENDKIRINEQIKEFKNKLLILNNQKSQYISSSAESLAAQDSAVFFIENFIFLDIDLKNNVRLSDSDEIFNKYLAIYDEYLNNFSNINIQKAALSTSFQNMIYISCGSCMDIFGRPVIKLTKYQIDLLMWGNYYQKLIKNCTKDIPPELFADPDKFIEWYESVNNIEISKKVQKKRKDKKSKYGSESKFLFGDRDDIKKIGGEIRGDKILQDAEQSGGTLGIYDLMEK